MEHGDREGGPVVVRTGVGVGTGVEENAGRPGVADQGGGPQGGEAGVVAVVDVGTQREQRLGHRRVVAGRAGEEGGRAEVVDLRRHRRRRGGG